MGWLSYLWLLLGLVGHFALWFALFNRIHATGLPRRCINASEKFHVLAFVTVPVLWFSRLLIAGFPGDALGALFAERQAEFVYFATCCLFFVYVAAVWTYRRWTEKPTKSVLSNHDRTFDVREATSEPLSSGLLANALSLVPGNEMTKLCVNVKQLAFPQLHPRLEGVSIAHLSDLHFTGKLKRRYFDFVIDRTNELEADLIVITGDIVDKDHCIEWIPETLGRLRSRFGVYFILGNHDKRVSDVALLRKTLTDCGLIDVGGRWQRIDVRGVPLLLAGNERPWFGPAPDVPLRREADGDETLRLLLSHSPDQIPWARRHQFDLMFAGHTHGGQIQFPIVGPLVAPSNFGVKYANGVFHEPPTLVHVSRGISGLDPIRLNCLPELTKLVLRCETERVAPCEGFEPGHVALAATASL